MRANLQIAEKEDKVEWGEKCKTTFDIIKEYLSNLPVLSPPRPRLPLRLYLIITDTTARAMFSQILDRSEPAILEQEVHTVREEIYQASENMPCPFLGIQETHALFTSTSVHIVSQIDPLKFMFEKPTLSGPLSRWLVML